MMHEYKAEVVRDGRWWMVHVPEIEDYTQARRLSEAELMARELIAVDTDVALSEVSVHIVSITVPGIGDILASADAAKHAREDARHAEAHAAAAIEQYVKTVTNADVPVRDIAELIDVSPQRVSQLANA